MLEGMCPPKDRESAPLGRATATFRLYAELNDFLAPERRYQSFEHAFDGTPSVKDRIESLGVPHTEVDLVLVDGRAVDFGHRLRGGERVAVYPVFEAFDVGDVSRLRPQPLREPRFILDVHLGRLAGYLRALGFDCLYANDFSDEFIIRTAQDEHRIILTRDTGLLKDGRVTHGRYVHATDPLQQLREVVDRFQLAGLFEPFSRCMRCNGELRSIDGAALADSVEPSEVPPGVLERFVAFVRCSGCGRVYWRGSHYDRLRQRFRSVGIDI
ncbi:Mut7-C RNAse domain-containing protein [Thioalkalivibrio sp. ALE30]|uniref:Mut7-C RNAse domain-containing protein n=1 Tax=Thioalkalivibrio sp. ALE30 TaxID=1158181 RepID=UPI00036E24C1|nr:Mut7-C RNAse domain-containing protein [Thioalkalivibrio sp. ALE30]